MNIKERYKDYIGLFYKDREFPKCGNKCHYADWLSARIEMLEDHIEILSEEIKRNEVRS